MTHTPPVPAANQAPFPRNTPPEPVTLPPMLRGVSNTKSSNNFGMMVGIGAVALFAGFMLFRNANASTKPVTKAKRPAKGKATG